MHESCSAAAMSVSDLAERLGELTDGWSGSGPDSVPLDFRSKVVAAGLALGTALVLDMLGLGNAFVLLLVLMGPVLTLRPVRSRLFSQRRETFAAYYVAWLYGPLGWGTYKGVRWAQVLGAALLLGAVIPVI